MTHNQSPATPVTHEQVSTMSDILEVKLSGLNAGPVYAQIRDQFDSRIRQNLISAGTSLPGPRVLAQKLSVDRGEIQRAYYELELAGLIEKKKSKDFLGKEKITYIVKST